MIVDKIEITKLTPIEGKRLKNIHTGEVYDDYIFLAKSQTKADFCEITKEEYDTIVEAELEVIE